MVWKFRWMALRIGVARTKLVDTGKKTNMKSWAYEETFLKYNKRKSTQSEGVDQVMCKT